LRDDGVVVEDLREALRAAVAKADAWDRAASDLAAIWGDLGAALEGLATFEGTYASVGAQPTAALATAAKACAATRALGASAAAVRGAALQPFRDHAAALPNALLALQQRQRQLLTSATLKRDLEVTRSRLQQAQLAPGTKAKKASLSLGGHGSWAAGRLWGWQPPCQRAALVPSPVSYPVARSPLAPPTHPTTAGGGAAPGRGGAGGVAVCGGGGVRAPRGAQHRGAGGAQGSARPRARRGDGGAARARARGSVCLCGVGGGGVARGASRVALPTPRGLPTPAPCLPLTLRPRARRRTSPASCADSRSRPRQGGRRPSACCRRRRLAS
jgi:hypothetical protein